MMDLASKKVDMPSNKKQTNRFLEFFFDFSEFELWKIVSNEKV